MARPLPRLAPAPRASKTAYSVRVFEAPRQNKRTLARLLQANNGDVPENLKPRLLKTFQVEATSLHQARTMVSRRLQTMGLKIRALNRGKRDFIAYVAHPEDINAPHPTA